MTDLSDRDDPVRAWILLGQEVAPAEFVEQTLRPIPRMRQRRSWRIALDRLVRPATALVTAAATIAIAVVIVGLFNGLPGLGGAAGSLSPSASSSRPTFQMTISAFADAGTYISNPTAGLDYCIHSPDGSWRLQYQGGQPPVNLDVLVGGDAAQPGGSGHVAADITFEDQTLHIDPSDLRGGDFPLGRSSASVQVRPGATTTTFVMTAITPDRSTGQDGGPVQVDLTLVCPN